MTKEVLKVDGLRELELALADLPKATGRNVMRRAMIKALTPMERQAEGLAPSLTGDLRRGISVGTKLSKRQMAQHRKDIGAKTVKTESGFRSTAQTTLFMFMGPIGSAKSIVQEFGSSTQSPHPYMRPAWDSNRVQMLDTIKDELWKEIEVAAARLARKAAKLMSKV